jgi:thiamine biosynthesis lipoprotein ApbE
MTFDRLLAAVVFAVCIAMLLRLVIGARRRQRLDAALQRATRAARALVGSVRHRRDAARAADEAIERARRRVDREGNVYTPKSFRKPPRDKMH